MSNDSGVREKPNIHPKGLNQDLKGYIILDKKNLKILYEITKKEQLKFLPARKKCT